MQFRTAVALLICAGLVAQPDAALVKSHTVGFLSAKGSHAPEAEPEPEPEPQKESVEAHTENGYGSTKVSEQIERTSITSKEQKECVCPLGEFWHFRIKKCVKQGAWGYACGFFPAEHWKNVCQDGLVCRGGASTGSCQACTAEEKCLTGEARQNKECLKQHIMHGKACTQVKVTLSVDGFAEANQQEKYAVNIFDGATAAVKATASATAKATTSTEVEKTVTAKAAAKSVFDTKMKVTVDGKTVDRTVIGHGSADASATRTATGSATESATATAKAQGSAKITRTVVQHASATEWGKAKVSGQKGDGTSKACVTIDEVRGVLGLAKDQRVGPVWAAEIISKGDQMAIIAAHKQAVKLAIKESKINTLDAAKAAAEAQALENAKLEAEAKGRKASARRAEAGATDMATELAEAKAIKKATAEAKSEAIRKSKAEAETVASNKAVAKAARLASEEAESKAQDFAKKEAMANALNHAAWQAKKDADKLEISRAATEKLAAASKAQAGKLAKKHAKAEEALDKVAKAEAEKKKSQLTEDEANVEAAKKMEQENIDASDEQQTKQTIHEPKGAMEDFDTKNRAKEATSFAWQDDDKQVGSD